MTKTARAAGVYSFHEQMTKTARAAGVYSFHEDRMGRRLLCDKFLRRLSHLPARRALLRRAAEKGALRARRALRGALGRGRRGGGRLLRLGGGKAALGGGDVSRRLLRRAGVFPPLRGLFRALRRTGRGRVGALARKRRRTRSVAAAAGAELFSVLGRRASARSWRSNCALAGDQFGCARCATRATHSPTRSAESA